MGGMQGAVGEVFKRFFLVAVFNRGPSSGGGGKVVAYPTG